MVAVLAVRFSAVTAMLCAALVVPAVAQVPDAGLVWWSFGFSETATPSADEVLRADRDLSPIRYRMYGARERIELHLNVQSSTSAPALISQARLRAILSFRMFADGVEIPIVVLWEPTVRHGAVKTVSSDLVSEASDLVSDVPLPPKGQMIFRLAVQRADGLPFAAAEYTVVARTPGLLSAISTADGAPWPGSANEGGRPVPLAIVEPTTPSEISLMHYLAGEDLYFRRRSPADAVVRFELAVQADPSNTGAQRMLGNTYMSLGWYRLAVITYENLVALPLERHRENLRALAVAYVADRDEARATRVLREVGLPSAEIEPALARMREEVRELDEAHARVPR
jgi:hypothetical protein